jgi:hypothetical protein
MTIMANDGMEGPESEPGHVWEHAVAEHRHVEEHSALYSRHLAAHESVYARHGEQRARLAERHVTDHERAANAMAARRAVVSLGTPGNTWELPSATRSSLPG